MSDNPIIQKLPKHLHSYIIEQNYKKYTARDQAVWRYIMKRNLDYLSKVAHKSYVNGLKTTGISTDHIPSTEEMNESLGKIGWAAVTVDGFIPPAAFMEFQKHRVLVIAADIRPFDQIEYTPAPDIVHEAAGHAPIIADPEYAEYLRYFGEIGSRAFSSANDYKIYEAIRHLSILKANPYSKAKNIEKAEKELDTLSSKSGLPSEMALIRNLHWWTVEYGLIGSMDQPKIYGAGLLSSIGESKNALRYEVTKIPYTIDAMDYSFDITKPQPQLFVTPDFKQLTKVLDEFANQMALRTGGLDGLMKAIESGKTATIEYSSGLQVSGTFTDVLIYKGRPIYVNTQGPTTLNFKNKLIEGEGKQQHAEGYGSPIGKIKGCLKPTRFLSDVDLKNMGIEFNKECEFEFESGVKVKGVLQRILRKENTLLLLSFSNCTVKHNRKTLFEPAWGQYDMAVGESIVSAFAGPADVDSFELKAEAAKEKTQKIIYDSQTIKTHNIYEALSTTDLSVSNANERLAQLLDAYEKTETEDWLLLTEFRNSINMFNLDSNLKEKVEIKLKKLIRDNPNQKALIQFGTEA